MSSVVYSTLCNSDRELYLAYLRAVCHNGSTDVVGCRWNGSSSGTRRDCCRDNDAVSAFLDVAVHCVAGRPSPLVDCPRDSGYVHSESVVDSGVERSGLGAVEPGGVSSGDVAGCVGDVRGGDVDDGVSQEVVGACDDAQVDGGSMGGRREAPLVGRWHSKNVAKRARRRARLLEQQRASVGVDTVVSQSSCPSYGQAVSEAEREAKETLARRRAAENKLKEKLALMKLASLGDERKCQEYAELKRSRVIQWTNEAVAKSQQSLEKCKSVDPGSSASQYDIRRQAKELADLRYLHDKFVESVKRECGDISRFVPESRVGTETLDRLQLEGEMLGGFDDNVEYDIY